MRLDSWVTGRLVVRVGIVLSMLIAGGAGWWLLASQGSGRSTVGVQVSAGATAGTGATVASESSGTHETEPLTAASGQALLPLSQAQENLELNANAESDAKGDTGSSVPVAEGSASGGSYTWHDGDRALMVREEPDLVVMDGAVVSRDGIAPQGDGGLVGQSDDGVGRPGTALPVFRSDEGELMALPGGVVLVLDPDWDGAAVNAFFERNGIAAGRLTALDYVTNGFFVETEPGFVSLDLANAFAGQAGVELSSPNWWKEAVTE